MSAIASSIPTMGEQDSGRYAKAHVNGEVNMSADMSEWNNMPWIYQDWVGVAGIALLGVALVVSIVWFIDGVKKYWYEK